MHTWLGNLTKNPGTRSHSSIIKSQIFHRITFNESIVLFIFIILTFPSTTRRKGRRVRIRSGKRRKKRKISVTKFQKPIDKKNFKKGKLLYIFFSLHFFPTYPTAFQLILPPLVVLSPPFLPPPPGTLAINPSHRTPHHHDETKVKQTRDGHHDEDIIRPETLLLDGNWFHDGGFSFIGLIVYCVILVPLFVT